MAYVVPNSLVQLFQGVPLNSEDTILFTTESLQNIYFAQNLRATFTSDNFTFIKKETKTIRVEANYGKVYQCNYLRYNNTANANKWIYAFITDVNYVNENVTEISFEIDRLQTWLPGIDYELTECYVEREHQATDVVGDNIIPENLPLGELIDDEIAYKKMDPEYLAVLLSANDSTIPFFPTETFSARYDNVPNGFIIVLFPLDNVTYMEMLPNFVTDPSLAPYIEGAYTIPSGIIEQYDKDAITITTTKTSYSVVIVKKGTIISPKDIFVAKYTTGTFDGYTPKNNKLFTFPYNRLVLSTSQGSEKEFLFELFKDDEENPGNVKFKMFSSITPPLSACLIPVEYGNSSDKVVQHYGCKLNDRTNMNISAIGGFSGEMWTSNLRNQISSITNMVTTSIAGVGAAAATGGTSLLAAGILLGTFSKGVGDSIQGAPQADVKVINNQSPDNINVANRFIGWDFFRRTITAKNAERIDNFFSAFGYRCDDIKIPNINVRQKWTYTKTSNANFISKNVPADDMKIINEKFNSGIRFHKTYASIGHITQDNPVLGGE